MIGEILDGKYHIEQRLGAGGMGNVYLATHLGTTRLVAVKMIAPKWSADPHFLARFQREAQACGRLRHPNIVNVTDFGIARTARGQAPYLVMELLDGETLSDFARRQPRPALPLVADLLDQVALALGEAHQRGIVHRDLKPDNIWLEPNGRGGYTVKVLDFGVAKVNLPVDAAARPTRDATVAAVAGDDSETVVIDMGSAPARAEEAETVAIATPSNPSSGAYGSDAGGQTMPGSLVGTPAYMSPEQALGGEIDFRSDIYSLAVVAYSLVCGRLPFAGKAGDLVEFHRSGEPAPPASFPGVPRDVSGAILAGLARDPAARPASAIEFARRFHNAVDAEFLALRRGRAFLLQHLGVFALLMIPIYGTAVAVTLLTSWFLRKVAHFSVLQMVAAPLGVALVLIFSDSVLRAAAALIAVDEQAGVRRLQSFRVLWRLIKMIPMLLRTQAAAVCSVGKGQIVGDCLWPVVCAAEKLSGRAAVERSRVLMTGLRSAGRALAIRHLGIAAPAIAAMLKSVAIFLRTGGYNRPDLTTTAIWVPVFVIFSAAPLFLYDRTAGKQSGPLLQLDRTPEVRTTARPLSISSIVWLVMGALYLLWTPLESWIFNR